MPKRWYMKCNSRFIKKNSLGHEAAMLVSDNLPYDLIVLHLLSLLDLVRDKFKLKILTEDKFKPSFFSSI